MARGRKVASASRASRTVRAPSTWNPAPASILSYTSSVSLLSSTTSTGDAPRVDLPGGRGIRSGS